MDEKFPADWQLDPKQIDTPKVQMWSGGGIIMTAQLSKKDAQRLVKDKKAFVITGQTIGLFESLVEGVDQNFAKKGIAYAKKKYKYNSSELKDLVKDLLIHMKTGEIENEPNMEAYIFVTMI